MPEELQNLTMKIDWIQRVSPFWSQRYLELRYCARRAWVNLMANSIKTEVTRLWLISMSPRFLEAQWGGKSYNSYLLSFDSNKKKKLCFTLSLKFYFYAGPKLKFWYLEFVKSKMYPSKICKSLETSRSRPKRSPWPKRSPRPSGAQLMQWRPEDIRHFVSFIFFACPLSYMPLLSPLWSSFFPRFFSPLCSFIKLYFPLSFSCFHLPSFPVSQSIVFCFHLVNTFTSYPRRGNLTEEAHAVSRKLGRKDSIKRHCLDGGCIIAGEGRGG